MYVKLNIKDNKIYELFPIIHKYITRGLSIIIPINNPIELYKLFDEDFEDSKKYFRNYTNEEETEKIIITHNALDRNIFAVGCVNIVEKIIN